MTNICINKFVKRQTKDSEYSYYDGPFEKVRRLVEDAFVEHQTPGYRDGVVLVSVPVWGFYSGVITLQHGDKLSGTFDSRRKGESPRKSIQARDGDKLPAKRVDVVLYSSVVLSGDSDNDLPPVEGNWEIISINASPEEEEMPINPDVLMHNHFGSDGGTATGLSDSEFVSMLQKSFVYWKDKAMASKTRKRCPRTGKFFPE